MTTIMTVMQSRNILLVKMFKKSEQFEGFVTTFFFIRTIIFCGYRGCLSILHKQSLQNNENRLHSAPLKILWINRNYIVDKMRKNHDFIYNYISEPRKP